MKVRALLTLTRAISQILQLPLCLPYIKTHTQKKSTTTQVSFCHYYGLPHFATLSENYTLQFIQGQNEECNTTSAYSLYSYAPCIN